jgi:membrane-bound transcription factor site-1 protease
LDWNADHPHTNFKDLYNIIRDQGPYSNSSLFSFVSHVLCLLGLSGYYLEILGRDFTCFDADHYGTLLIVDPEEEFFVEEIEKLQKDVSERGLNLMILGEWYNTATMAQLKFFDQNTRRFGLPRSCVLFVFV